MCVCGTEVTACPVCHLKRVAQWFSSNASSENLIQDINSMQGFHEQQY